MSYLSSLTIAAEKEHPFPFDIPAVKFAKDIDLDHAVSFFIGDNGTGKSKCKELEVAINEGLKSNRYGPIRFLTPRCTFIPLNVLFTD